MKCHLVLLGIFFAAVEVTSQQKVFFCYWGTWANYRQGNGKFTVNDIDPFVCTHIIYSFFGVNIDGHIRYLDPYLDLTEDWGLGFINQLNDLKRINPNLKTMMAVGGWNEGSNRFSQLAKDPTARATFAQEAVEFCDRHGFDGFDLHWKYPGQRDGDPDADRENFSILVNELSQTLHSNELLFTAAVAAAENSAIISYDIPSISKDLDYINVLAFDLHGYWEPITGINAPLYSGPLDRSPDDLKLNVDACINFWINSGAPREKLVLGMPLYGNTFTIKNSSNNSVGAPAIGPGLGGQYVNEPGILGYNEFCEKHWKIRRESTQRAPYAFNGDQWIGFDDEISLSEKSWYARNQNLSGVMVWSIDTDDFQNVCGRRNILIETIKCIFLFGLEAPCRPSHVTLNE